MNKKLTSVLLCASLFITAFAACSKDSDKDETEKPADDTAAVETEAAADEGFILTYNGQELTIGVPFTDVADGLGDELRPAEDIEPCDGEGDTMTLHWYDGLEVGSDESGIIRYFSLSQEGDVSFQASTDKGLQLLDDRDRAVELYGTPDSENEYVISYTSGDQMMTLGISDAGAINYIYINTIQ